MLVRFLDSDKPLWQRTLAMEVLHSFTNHPLLLRSANVLYCTVTPEMLAKSCLCHLNTHTSGLHSGLLAKWQRKKGWSGIRKKMNGWSKIKGREEGLSEIRGSKDLCS